MSRPSSIATTLCALAGLLAALAAAALLPAAQGLGALAGYASGGLIAGLMLGLQRRVARSTPQYVVHAVLGGFLVKSFAMLALTLAVRYVEPLASTLDAVAYLLGFAAALGLVLVPGTLETLRSLQAGAEARAA